MRWFIIIVSLLIIPGLILAVEKEPLKEEFKTPLEKLPLIDEPPLVGDPPKITQPKRRSKIRNPEDRIQITQRSVGSTLRKERKRPTYLKEEKVTTVGEIVETLLPQVLKEVDAPSLSFLTDQEGIDSPLQSKDESLLGVTPPITRKRSNIEADVEPKRRLNFIMSGIGLAGLIGFGVALLIRRYLKTSKSTLSNNRVVLEEKGVEDPRSDLIYKGWWHDDMKSLQRTYKERIDDLGQKVERRILIIEDNQSRLSQSVTEMKEKLEDFESLITDNSRRSKRKKSVPRPSFEEVVRLSRDGLDINEIAKKTRIGKGEIELILKTQEWRQGSVK